MPACAFMFLPFTAIDHRSYVLRTINTLIAGRLASNPGLGAADVGLLTSIYFLIAIAVQVPTGMPRGLGSHPGPERAAAGCCGRRRAL